MAKETSAMWKLPAFRRSCIVLYDTVSTVALMPICPSMSAIMFAACTRTLLSGSS